MVFRNFAGGIVWWRVVVVIALMLLVALYFLAPGLLGLGKKAEQKPVGPVVLPAEPEIDPSLIKPFSGSTTKAAQECGQKYCIDMKLFGGGEYTVAYPKSMGAFPAGIPLSGTGVITGDKIESVTIGMLMDRVLPAPGG